jgi:hypothetical protein
VALLGSASTPVRTLLNLSTRDASAVNSTDAGPVKPYLQWTSDHSREFSKLLRSYFATLEARLRLSLAAIHEIGPSASTHQGSGQAATSHMSFMDAFHAPADANLYAILRDSCDDSWADPTQALAKGPSSTFFLGPCFGEAALIWFASGERVIRGCCFSHFFAQLLGVCA